MHEHALREASVGWAPRPGDQTATPPALGGSVATGPGTALRPVIALGAAGAPARLSRVFRGVPAGIPVARGILHDRAVVYAAELLADGSLPATLVPWPGAAAWVFVVWVTGDQLARMRTVERQERGAVLVPLRGIDLEVEEQGRIGQAAAFLSPAPALAADGHPIRIGEVPTTGCTLPALTEPALLRWLARTLAPDTDPVRLVARLAVDAGFRAEMAGRLPRVALLG